jgi:hypothetical protein
VSCEQLNEWSFCCYLTIVSSGYVTAGTLPSNANCKCVSHRKSPLQINILISLDGDSLLQVTTRTAHLSVYLQKHCETRGPPWLPCLLSRHRASSEASGLDTLGD